MARQRDAKGTEPLVDEAWLQSQLSGLSRDVQAALKATIGLPVVAERLGHTIGTLLEGIEAVERVTTARARARGIAKLQRVADTLYVLHEEATGEPLKPGDPLIYSNGRRGVR